ncbi:E3 ubiquitin-protein ligase RNF103-like [Ischnura elegans]|uniref:E3 ubiquitin-protein ligase RNF103-like n=1 Tax=Ischnura elegans TaxID=197161 RepID=UPI001ED87855|nr:E3 ubiquitin-protein ligase RNF103-like [Ischnura elegans]
MSRSICIQIFLLILYLSMIFIISRLHDLVLWLHNGFSSTEIVDPLLLSVRQLKHLLEVRGVSYNGCVEKHELASLVDASADVTQGEAAESIIEISNRGNDRLSDYAAKPPSSFTGGPHFYEEVEDTKDSVWLVQVVPAQGSRTGIGIGSQQQAEPLLDDYSWRVVCNQLAPFAVRTGIFDCRLDRRLCINKGWHRPLLLLALPRGWRAKDKVVMRTSTFTRPQAIMEWVREQLAVRLSTVKDLSEAENEWIRRPEMDGRTVEMSLKAQNVSEEVVEAMEEHDENQSQGSGDIRDGKSEDVRVLLVTHLLHPPLFLAALSIKFTGRIRFGVLMVRKEDKETVKKRLGLSRVPSYLVTTPEHTVVYGSRPREHFNVGSMNAFLRAIHPETNDAFLFSLALTNALVFLQLFQVSGGLWRHAASCIWVLVSHNLWLFSMWLVVLGTWHFPLASVVISRLRVPARWLAMSEFGSLLRSDWMALLDYPLLLFSSLALYACVVTAVLHWLRTQQASEASVQSVDSDGVSGAPQNNSVAERAWWEVFPMDSFFLDCFFRPVSSSTPSVSSPSLGSGDLELEEGIEMLIERLEMPDLWLRLSVPKDYLKDLPIWRHGSSNLGDGKHCSAKASHASASPEDKDLATYILELMDGDTQGGWTQGQGSSVCRQRTHLPTRRETVRQSRIRRDWWDIPLECQLRESDFENPAECRCIVCSGGSTAAGNSGLSSSSEGEESGGEVGLSSQPPPGILYTSECVVCLEAYCRGAVLCGLPCGHNYHHSCIMTWLTRDNHHCPVCRWPAYRSKPAHVKSAIPKSE